MVTVDSKGRIVLPKEIREDLGLGPGSEVTIAAERGRVVVEPEDDPAQIIADLEARVERATREQAESDRSDLDPIARDHLETVRRGAGETNE